MKSNELRINNLVNIGISRDFKDIHGFIESFNCEKAIVSYNNERHVFLLKYINPIPLTEEWHNKFGVTKNGFGSFEYVLKNNHNLYLTVLFTGDYVMIRQGKNKSIEDDVISIWNKDVIKRNMYVHEWQNLFFTLTGEELEIKS